MKKCFDCHEEKPIAEFYKSSVGYISSKCRLCSIASAAQWNRDNRDHVNTRERGRKYGLTASDLAELIEAQDGLCAICNEVLMVGGKLGSHIDHDHVTGKTRGILCMKCNLLLGHAKDSPTVLRAAAKYIETSGGGISDDS